MIDETVTPPTGSPISRAAPARPRWAARVAEALKPANIVWAIPGPIFHKEMWLAGRRSGTYWIRGVYTVLLLALTSLVYTVSRAESYGSPSQQLQKFQGMAPMIAYAMGWFQMAALPLAAIILASPAISDEKRAGTLGTLLTTPLRAWQIVFGKLASTIVQLLVLALVSTPLLLAMRLFGGLTAEFVFAMLALSISGAVLAGSLSVFHSIGAKRSPSAAGAALIMFIVSQGICPLVVWALSDMGLGIVQLAPQWYILFCPPAVMGLLMIDLQTAMSPVPMTLAWGCASAYNLALAGAIFVAAALRLRSVMRTEGEAGAAIPSAAAVSTNATQAAPLLPGQAGAPVLASPAPSRKMQERGGSREVHDRPVFWREALQPMFKRRWHGIVLASAVVLFFSWLYYELWWIDLHDEGLHFPITVIGCGMMLLLAIFGSSTLVAGERESRTWDALLATPMSAWELVWSKFLGFLRRQWLVAAIVFSHFAFMSVLGVVDWQVMFLLPVVYAAPLAATIATGIFFSTVMTRSVRTAAANFFLWLGVWAVVPIVGAILSIGMRGGNESLLAVIGFFNPFGMSVVTMTGLIREWQGTPRDGFDYYGVDNLNLFEFAGVLFGYTAFHAGVVFVALKAAARRIADATARLV